MGQSIWPAGHLEAPRSGLPDKLPCACVCLLPSRAGQFPRLRGFYTQGMLGRGGDTLFLGLIH